ncbi:hypothetical protein ACK12G_12150 [Mycolicibacterium wolinskyi]|uniref:hypothetical protein n=1 Tax=Mycolicibacterium wolinskyi TaxID=59750 RepID=UPI0039177EBB
MTLPPPPDSYGSQPPNGGGVPPWGGQPPQGSGGQPPYPGAPQSQPYGQPYQGQPGGAQQWGPQQQWAGGPPPPPNKGGKGKWILVGLALVAVIAVSVVATVLVLRPDSGGNGNGTPTANGDSEFASANDTGPANVITEDPTCDAWGRISRDYSAQAESVKWADRDPKVSADDWTPEQRTVYDTVGKALTDAVSLTPNLQKQTPHRVMRELYGQFIAYATAFVDAIPKYDASFEPLANATGGLISAIANVCAAIDYDAIQSLAPLISEPKSPSDAATIDTENERFLVDPISTCSQWIPAATKYSDATEPWIAVDPKIPSTEWTPEQRSIYDAVGQVMSDYANQIEELGRQSDNGVLEDIAVLSAQYFRAFVIAIPNYSSNDNLLAESARFLSGTIYWACKAAE